MNYEQEIIDLHDFFTGWFTGSLPETAFDRLDQALVDNYSMAVDSGAYLSRDDVINGIRNGYGQRQDFRIWITNVDLKHHHNDILIVTYYEWQEVGDKTTRRSSTVIFREEATAPNGLRWLHVHESGLQEIESLTL